MEFQTRDLEQAVQTVGQVYCPHRLRLDPRTSALDTRLSVRGAGRWPVVRLSYGAHVKVDAGDFPDLFLFMHCTGGEGLVWQGSREAVWRGGVTLPVSANRPTGFEFGPRFSQVTVRLERQKLETLCAQWLGHALDDDLRFELSPLSPPVEQAWRGALALVEAATDDMPAAAADALETFLLTLLVRGHRHTFTDQLDAPVRSVGASRLVQRAEALVVERFAEAPCKVGDLAAALGVSVRALQTAFQQVLQTTPTAYLRDRRLQQVHDDLLRGESRTSVTDLALQHGFFHLGRFAGHYRERFGETPAETLRRHRRSR